jgi:TrmH family RNA methyltransferase
LKTRAKQSFTVETRTGKWRAWRELTPAERNVSWEQIEAVLEPLTVYLAAAGDGDPYWESDFCPPLALIIGGEAEGAGPQAQRLAEKCVCIPMPGGGESLNAAAQTVSLAA